MIVINVSESISVVLSIVLYVVCVKKDFYIEDIRVYDDDFYTLCFKSLIYITL